jgi:hypothetical protein
MASMSTSAPDKPEDKPKDMPKKTRSTRTVLIVALAAAAVIVTGLWLTPPYTFDPFCTYDLSYRLNARIEVDGKQYSSEVTRQNSRSKQWVQVMNSAGCQQTYGTALSFRLADNRAVLIGTQICSDAEKKFADPSYEYPPTYIQAMRERRTIDPVPSCRGTFQGMANPQSQPHGFVVDNADQPARWEAFRFGEKLRSSDSVIRLVSATAQAMDVRPTDDLEKVAPGVLKTSFEYKEWWNSPERIVDFHRRNSKGMTYKVAPY